MSLFSWFEAEFSKLLAHFQHHQSAGTVPTTSVVAPVPVVTPAPAVPATPAVPAAPTPAPVAAPVASAPVVSPPVPSSVSALPDGVLAIDGRGFAKLSAIEAERASNPKWANACAWYAIEGITPESLTARANLTEAKFLLMMGSSGAVSDGAAALNTAYEMTPNATGFGYARGTPYSDALSFIGDNGDGAGNVIYRGPRPSDMTAFVAACNATGRLPIIDHSQRGAVA